VQPRPAHKHHGLTSERRREERGVRRTPKSQAATHVFDRSGTSTSVQKFLRGEAFASQPAKEEIKRSLKTRFGRRLPLPTDSMHPAQRAGRKNDPAQGVSWPSSYFAR